jgi:hypothetical protein
MTQSISGIISTGKIFVKDSSYRMEMKEGDQDVIVVMNSELRKTFVLMPSSKQYIEMESNSMRSMVNDPFQSVKYMNEKYDKKLIGIENVDNYECEMFLITAEDQELITQWVSNRLNFILKIVYAAPQDRMMELTNIQENPIDNDLFILPDDYIVFKRPRKKPVQVPVWVKDLDSSPVLTPPFEKVIGDEELVRIKIEAGYGVKVTGKNNQEGNSAITAVPLKGINPIKDPSMKTMNLTYKDQAVTFKFEEIPQEADYIVVRIREGSFLINVEQYKTDEGQSISAGGEFRFPIEWDKYTKMRALNVFDGESIFIVSFYSNGQILSEDQIGPEEFRTITLEAINESTTRTYTTNADELVVTVKEGEVIVRVNNE